MTYAREPKVATGLIHQRSQRVVLTGRQPAAGPPGAAVFFELSWSQGGQAVTRAVPA